MDSAASPLLAVLSPSPEAVSAPRLIVYEPPGAAAAAATAANNKQQPAPSSTSSSYATSAETPSSRQNIAHVIISPPSDAVHPSADVRSDAPDGGGDGVITAPSSATAQSAAA